MSGVRRQEGFRGRVEVPARSINGRVEMSLVAFAINLQGFIIAEEEEENGKRVPPLRRIPHRIHVAIAHEQ